MCSYYGRSCFFLTASEEFPRDFRYYSAESVESPLFILRYNKDYFLLTSNIDCQVIQSEQSLKVVKKERSWADIDEDEANDAKEVKSGIFLAVQNAKIIEEEEPICDYETGDDSDFSVSDGGEEIDIDVPYYQIDLMTTPKQFSAYLIDTKKHRYANSSLVTIYWQHIHTKFVRTIQEIVSQNKTPDPVLCQII